MCIPIHLCCKINEIHINLVKYVLDLSVDEIIDIMRFNNEFIAIAVNNFDKSVILLTEKNDIDFHNNRFKNQYRIIYARELYKIIINSGLSKDDIYDKKIRNCHRSMIFFEMSLMSKLYDSLRNTLFKELNHTKMDRLYISYLNNGKCIELYFNYDEIYEVIYGSNVISKLSEEYIQNNSEIEISKKVAKDLIQLQHKNIQCYNDQIIDAEQLIKKMLKYV